MLTIKSTRGREGALKKLYKPLGKNPTLKKKMKMLEKALGGPSLFFANGGGETPEMELNAMEDTYCFVNGVFDIEVKKTA
jgi:hypothetical protein